MKKFAVIGGGLIVVAAVSFIAFGAFIQHLENQQFEEIEKLVVAGNCQQGFNLAQELIDKKSLAPVRAQALYWQSYCLYRKGELDEAKAKIKRMLSEDSGYDRMSEDEGFQKFYVNARR